MWPWSESFERRTFRESRTFEWVKAITAFLLTGGFALIQFLFWLIGCLLTAIRWHPGITALVGFFVAAFVGGVFSYGRLWARPQVRPAPSVRAQERRAPLHVVAARESRAVCPFCKASVLEGEPRVACEKCGTRHHEECFSDHERCAVFGCGERSSRRVPGDRLA